MDAWPAISRPGVYRAAPDAGIVRLYYLPASRHVVNLERLPDRTLAEGAIASPLEAIAEAILGRWQSGAVSPSFASDGTVAVTLPDGQERRGSWSVDPAGHLHADVAGVAEVGEAWVVGDTLTVLRDGAALTFHRR